jgi:hypothetical protein
VKKPKARGENPAQIYACSKMDRSVIIMAGIIIIISSSSTTFKHSLTGRPARLRDTSEFQNFANA